jgi:cytochrome c oxidase accessory protein FixG
MLFRKIEYLIEGDAHQQKKLAEADWDAHKIIKKSAKHTLFWLISFAIANTFLAYIIGVNELSLLMSEGLAIHLGKFLSLVLFTSVFYFVFARLRELVCIIICPYGRLQGLMLDKNSIVVAYDFIRGEPRGKLKKTKEAEAKPLGDCIDCKLCVQVCPTGIDIRNGTQLECVNCTACIDACNEVMEKVHKPQGLIRFDSLNGITKGKKFSFNPRNIAYSVVLLGLLSVFLYALITRKDIETTLLRTPGMLYQKQEAHLISNLYNIEFVNKTFRDLNVELKLIEPEGSIKLVEANAIQVAKESVGKASFFILRADSTIHAISTPVKIEVYENGQRIDVVKSKFNGPVFSKIK